MRPRAHLINVLLTCTLCLMSVQVVCASDHGNFAARHVDFRLTDFSKADSIAALYPEYPISDLFGLSMKLTKPLTSDEEKFRAIFMWVCSNISVDYDMFIKNRAYRQRVKNPEQLRVWNDKLRAQLMRNLIQHHTTVCSGYTYLVREMCALAGIEAVVVDGFGRSHDINVAGQQFVNHSWNAVKLNGNWYLCDPTWASGTYDRERGEFVQRYDDVWFLTDPALFVGKHYPLDAKWTLLPSPGSPDSALNAPVCYAATARHGITHMSPNKFRLNISKGERVSFRFATSTCVENVSLHLAGRTRVPDSATDIHVNRSSYRLERTFNTKGKFVVHVKVNGEVVGSWEVVVR